MVLAPKSHSHRDTSVCRCAKLNEFGRKSANAGIQRRRKCKCEFWSKIPPIDLRSIIYVLRYRTATRGSGASSGGGSGGIAAHNTDPKSFGAIFDQNSHSTLIFLCTLFPHVRLPVKIRSVSHTGTLKCLDYIAI